MPRPSTNTSQAVMKRILTNSPALEAYRSLRFNIECSEFGRDAKTITITSSSRGEGKTTTAVHLAVAYAQIGKKVLLLDADLRNPSIHFVFEMENICGLTNYLEGKATRHEIIKESIVDHLSFISAGPLTQNPSGLLASQCMDTLLAELSAEYDVIIVDTPSLLTISDAKIMATKCDGVLLIIEYGQLKSNVAKKVKEELMLANAKLIGVVLNEVKNHLANAYR